MAIHLPGTFRTRTARLCDVKSGRHTNVAIFCHLYLSALQIFFEAVEIPLCSRNQLITSSCRRFFPSESEFSEFSCHYSIS
jgi:hypothetical protein